MRLNKCVIWRRLPLSATFHSKAQCDSPPDGDHHRSQLYQELLSGTNQPIDVPSFLGYGTFRIAYMLLSPPCQRLRAMLPIRSEICATLTAPPSLFVLHSGAVTNQNLSAKALHTQRTLKTSRVCGAPAPTHFETTSIPARHNPRQHVAGAPREIVFDFRSIVVLKGSGTGVLSRQGGVHRGSLFRISLASVLSCAVSHLDADRALTYTEQNTAPSAGNGHQRRAQTFDRPSSKGWVLRQCAGHHVHLFCRFGIAK